MTGGSIFARSVKVFLWIVGVLVIFFVVVIMEAPESGRQGPRNATMQEGRQLGEIMYAYAKDHNGVYPTGKSSTEIFQKLIDEDYVNDPALFWADRLEVPGKTKAISKILKPENVCWDVTTPVDAQSGDDLPLVFLTGYRIDYGPGASATPLFPWAKDWKGIVVFYKGNNAAFLKNDGQPDGVVTNFISQTFDPAGKAYQQLTPDGPLGPR